MKATELRIGNYANHSELGVVEVIGTTKDSIHCKYSDENHYEAIGRFSGIPLTEEWLLRFGFEKKKNGGTFDEYYWSGKEMDLTLDLELSTSTSDYDSQYVSGSMQLQSVHQLQNLYFALTGEELTLKETV